MIADLNLFQTQDKNGIPKNINLLDTTSDNVPKFITKKWIEFHDQSSNTEDR